MDELEERLEYWVERVAPLAESFAAAERVAAWIGTRWQVKGKSFAHVATINEGRPESYAKAAGTDGPAVCLTFYIDGPELEVLAASGPPIFKPSWSRTVLGILLTESTDLGEIAELITESYCTRAPKRLAALVDRPPPIE